MFRSDGTQFSGNETARFGFGLGFCPIGSFTRLLFTRLWGLRFLTGGCKVSLQGLLRFSTGVRFSIYAVLVCDPFSLCRLDRTINPISSSSAKCLTTVGRLISHSRAKRLRLGKQSPESPLWWSANQYRTIFAAGFNPCCFIARAVM